MRKKVSSSISKPISKIFLSVHRLIICGKSKLPTIAQNNYRGGNLAITIKLIINDGHNIHQCKSFLFDYCLKVFFINLANEYHVDIHNGALLFTKTASSNTKPTNQYPKSIS